MIPLELNALLAFFQKEGYSAEIQAETNQIYFSIKTDTRDFPVFSRTFDESGLLQLLLFFPCTIEAKTVPDMARLLHMFNKELDLPGFGMDELSGVVFFRWMMPALKGDLQEESLKTFLSTLKTVCQTFSPVIEAIAAGAISFETLLEKARQKKP